MCVFSRKNKFCCFFKLETGTKFIICTDVILVLQIVIEYLFLWTAKKTSTFIEAFINIGSVPGDTEEEKQDNAYYLFKMSMLMSSVFFILLVYKTWKGILCWRSSFYRKNLETYFMYSFTYIASSTI